MKFLLWLMGDVAVAKLDDLIDQFAQPEDALSEEDRRDRLQQIAADALAIEHEEEALCVIAEQRGMAVARRGDLNPAAYLSVSLQGMKS